MVFRAFQGQVVCREFQASLDHKDPKEGKVQKDRWVKRDRKECRVQEDTKGAKGLLGRADPEESRELKVNQDLWECKESEAFREIKEKRERKENAPKQVKQV